MYRLGIILQTILVNWLWKVVTKISTLLHVWSLVCPLVGWLVCLIVCYKQIKRVESYDSMLLSENLFYIFTRLLIINLDILILRRYIEDLIRFIFQPLVLFSILQPFLWLFAATLAKWLHSSCIVELIKSMLGIFLSLSWIFNLSGNLHF